jgi:hypothetical protein
MLAMTKVSKAKNLLQQNISVFLRYVIFNLKMLIQNKDAK